METRGIEPLNLLTASQALSQLSYAPMGGICSMPVNIQFSPFFGSYRVKYPVKVPIPEADDLLNAIQALSQLSYTPVGEEQFSIFNASQLAETFGVVYRLVCSPS